MLRKFTEFEANDKSALLNTVHRRAKIDLIRGIMESC